MLGRVAGHMRVNVWLARGRRARRLVCRMADDLDRKVSALRGLLQQMERVLVCFSGGVDSSYVLAESVATLGERGQRDRRRPAVPRHGALRGGDAQAEDHSPCVQMPSARQRPREVRLPLTAGPRSLGSRSRLTVDLATIVTSLVLSGSPAVARAQCPTPEREPAEAAAAPTTPGQVAGVPDPRELSGRSVRGGLQRFWRDRDR